MYGIPQAIAEWMISQGLGTIGFLMGVVAVGLVGDVESYRMLVVAQIIASIGLGAFHPVAAAAMGQLSASNRAFGISLFYLAGMIGGISGHVVSPVYVKAFGHGVAVDGLHALAWLILPGVSRG